MLSEKAQRGLLFVLCYLIFLEGLSWVTAFGPPPCLVHTEQQAAGEHNQEYCATFLAGTLTVGAHAIDIVEKNDKAIVVSLGESFRAGRNNTGNVTATVGGKLVLSWHGTPTQKDGALKMFPIIQHRLMPGVPLENFADAMIASIHDEGMAQDDEGCNIQTIAMLWRLFTAPVDHDVPGLTFGDLIAVKNFHIAFEIHERPNDQFNVTWTINTMPGRR
jgi:hypothetical protein